MVKAKINRDDFKGKFEDMNSLSLEDMQTYAIADSVDEFYYTTSFTNL